MLSSLEMFYGSLSFSLIRCWCFLHSLSFILCSVYSSYSVSPRLNSFLNFLCRCFSVLPAASVHRTPHEPRSSLSDSDATEVLKTVCVCVSVFWSGQVWRCQQWDCAGWAVFEAPDSGQVLGWTGLHGSLWPQWPPASTPHQIQDPHGHRGYWKNRQNQGEVRTENTSYSSWKTGSSEDILYELKSLSSICMEIYLCRLPKN